jgi:O-antigen ligase
VTHPIFGVGPEQFADFQGAENPKNRLVAFSNMHNSYVEVAADMGIPGFLFYMAGTISMFVLLQRADRKARRAGRKDLSNACTCLLVGCSGFCVSIFFLNFGYLVFLPAMAGVAVAMSRAVDSEVADAATVRKTAPARVSMPELTPNPAFAGVQVPAEPVRNRFRFGRYR